MQTSVRPPQELAPTLPFRREEVTTRFTRDADDTVPVELYSQPYERLEIRPAMSITASTNLVARPPTRRPIPRPPHRGLRFALTLVFLCGTFALGFALAVLAL
ncbi:hypothetical protein BH11MYX3_BH11MYX3_47180 [soil metagenome]